MSKARRYFQYGLVKTIKKESGCILCGEKSLVKLTFHHRNPRTKSFTIGRKAGKISTGQLIKEIKKCDVMCEACQQKVHSHQNT